MFINIEDEETRELVYEFIENIQYFIAKQKETIKEELKQELLEELEELKNNHE